MSPSKHSKTSATIWTIGHSMRPIEEFLGLLTGARIKVIADMRSFPGSRKYPQYGNAALAATLGTHSIGYHWLQALGGRRSVSPDLPNTAWRNASFQGYADYMSSTEVEHGLAQLLTVARKARTAIMCAEAVWWRCHRSMIAAGIGLRIANSQDIAIRWVSYDISVHFLSWQTRRFQP
jgi:uncharacterized protein (DUF488 family)